MDVPLVLMECGSDEGWHQTNGEQSEQSPEGLGSVLILGRPREIHDHDSVAYFTGVFLPGSGQNQQKNPPLRPSRLCGSNWIRSEGNNVPHYGKDKKLERKISKIEKRINV